MSNSVNIIGAGLAGSEAALYLAKRGFYVELYDMKPQEKCNAHNMSTFCELVCNNSFCNTIAKTPLYLLFNELKALNSELIKYIEKARVNDRNCIAVDRRYFSQLVTEALYTNEKINIIEKVLCYFNA